MPVSSAICDIVTERSPFSVTRVAVVETIASRTSRRCSSIVSVQSLGTSEVYGTPTVDTVCIDRDSMSLYLWNDGSSRGGGAVDPETENRKRRWPIALGIVVAVAFLGLMIALHLSGGLGPGQH